MPRSILLGEQLLLPRCPHCSIDTPNLSRLSLFETTDFNGFDRKYWGLYSCRRCGGVVLAMATKEFFPISACYPQISTISTEIPERARTYLSQALDSLHAPAGAVMLAASSIDSMLKEKGYKEGSLNKRIEEAAATHLITEGMKEWAHKVRLGANEQRHSDENASLPSVDEARNLIDFAKALGEFLFVLPALVKKGAEDVSTTS